MTVQQATANNGHWASVMAQGHEKIDTAAFGPAVTSIDTSNPASMRRTIRELYGKKGE